MALLIQRLYTKSSSLMHERCLDNTAVSDNVKSVPLSIVACELFYSLSCSVFSVLNYVIFFF